MNDISKMPRIAAPISDSEADALDAGVLAFVGDAVQTLAVRTRLALSMGTKSGEMHRAQIREVSAEAQAKAFRNIEKLLSEEEMRVYKRSRNTPHLFVQAHRRIRLYRGYRAGRADGVPVPYGQERKVDGAYQRGIFFGKRRRRA